MTNGCDEKCWTDVHCTVCGKRKQPHGRSVPLEAANSYCDYECRGYLAEPRAGHLWHEHDDTRHFTDPDGWAAHLVSCGVCRD